MIIKTDIEKQFYKMANWYLNNYSEICDFAIDNKSKYFDNDDKKVINAINTYYYQHIDYIDAVSLFCGVLGMEKQSKQFAIYLDRLEIIKNEKIRNLTIDEV